MTRTQSEAMTRRGVLRGALAAAGLMQGSRALGDEPQRAQIIGALSHHRVRAGETMHDIARAYDVGFVELRAANPGADAWVPPADEALLIPGAHALPYDAGHRIVINRADMRLYYFQQAPEPVLSWPIGIGRAAHETPLGALSVTEKRRAPVWRPTPELLAENPNLPAEVPPGPDNPLGDFAIRVGWDGYAIHGTNKPDGIGRRISRGCIRLYPEDIEVLFDLAQAGDAVRIADEPAKFGWVDGELYMEAHPSGAQADEIVRTGAFAPEPIEHLDAYLAYAAGAERHRIDWDAVRRVEHERRGVPVKITR